MPEVTEYSQRGAVGIIAIDSPPVNGLGLAVREGIAGHLAAALADDDVKAIVIHGGGRMFSAGADIKEFGTELAFTKPMLMDVITMVEDADKPIIAAIHGVAAGGGLELALGCHYRVASADARVGLPEVTLGIIPGAGGTQRPWMVPTHPRRFSGCMRGQSIPAPCCTGPEASWLPRMACR